MADTKTLIEQVYSAFYKRDIDGALEGMYLALRNLARKWNAVQGWKETLDCFPHKCA